MTLSSFLRTQAILLAIMSVALLGKGAEAGTVISLYGDIDCFGVPGVTSCPDGSNPFIPFVLDYRDPAELAANSLTDVLIRSLPTGFLSYSHNYSLPQDPVSASLSIRTAGINTSFPSSPYDVRFNGVSIGVIPLAQSNDVITFNYTVPVALLTGDDTVSWFATIGDGYFIDYSQLDITTPAVAEPASLALLGTGLAGMLVVARRRRRLARLGSGGCPFTVMVQPTLAFPLEAARSSVAV